MDNPFVGLKQTPDTDITGEQVVQKLAEKDGKQQRDAMYAKYTPMVYNVLDLLIASYRPGIWKKGSDSDHKFCCHCRWYAGPEETGRAHYDDHIVRRQVEIELEINDHFDPTGFNVWCHDGKCIHVGLSQDELVRGIKAVLYSFRAGLG